MLAVASCNTFIQIEELDTNEAFVTLSSDDTDVMEMAKHMASRSSLAAVGRVILGTMQSKRVQVRLVLWVTKDHIKRGFEIDPDMWTVDELMETLERNKVWFDHLIIFW